MPIVESALGIENAFSIATASPQIVALTIGLEDYTTRPRRREDPGRQ
jgi:citrate lyase subunit beta/citryl-CoA lyase